MMKVPSFLLLIVWHLIPAAIAINSLESFPAHINGELTACVADQISLTCSRDTDLSSGMTLWTVTSPTIPCVSVINHVSPVSIDRCDPFVFQNVTELPGSQPALILSSTAVATANVSMSGAVVQCFTSQIVSVAQKIGSNVTLCIPDMQPAPDNVQVRLMANGTVRISWNPPPVVCVASNISYDINLIPTDGSLVEEEVEVPTTTSETVVEFSLTAGREYDVFITASNTDCSILSATIQETFTATQNAVTTSQSSMTFSPTSGEIMTTQRVVPNSPRTTITIIIVVVIAAVIIILVIVISVILWYFCYKRPIVLQKRASTATPNVELKASEIDALVYDDPQPKVVPHMEAASGDLYAQPDKKSAESQGAYQKPSSIEHEQAPTGDFYAMPQQKGKKEKNQGSCVDPGSADIVAMYSTVDTSKKNQQLTYAQLDVGSGSGGKPVPQSTPYATVVS